MVRYKEEILLKCPEMKTIGDVDFCYLNECVCILMDYDTCDVFQSIKEEWEQEKEGEE